MFLFILIHLPLFKSYAFKTQKPHKLLTVIRIIGLSSIIAFFLRNRTRNCVSDMRELFKKAYSFEDPQ